MESFRILLILVVCTAVVYSESGSKCLPVQWQAQVVGSMAMDVLGMGISLPVTMETATDFHGKREAFHQHLSVHGDMKVDMNMVTDYNQMVEYIDVPLLKLCSKRNLTANSAPFVQQCNDSKSLTLTDSLMLGDRMIDMYTSVEYGETMRIAVFRDNFQMVHTTVQQKWQGIPQIVFMQYGNITDAVIGPEPFNLPSYCNTAMEGHETLQYIVTEKLIRPFL